MIETRRFPSRGWLRRAVGLSAALSLTACASSTSEGPARLEPGVRVRVQAPAVPPGQFEGELRAVEADTVSVLPSAGPTAVQRIPLAEVSKAEVSRGTRGNAGRGALYGGLTGAILGLVAVIADDSEDGWYDGTGYDVGVVAMMGLLGAGLGAAIGAAVQTEVWQEVPLESIRIEPTAGGIRVGVRLGLGP